MPGYDYGFGDYQSAPPVTGTGANTGTGSVPTKSGGGMTDWVQANYPWLASAAQIGLGAYQASQKPTYHQAELSPEEKALYTRYLQGFDNPATKYNASMVSDIARSDLGRLAPTLPWNRTERMSAAYSGLTPPPLSPSGTPQGTNSDYYNNLMRNSISSQQAWESGKTTNSAAPVIGGGQTPSGSSPIPGDTFGTIAAPAGTPGDPFASFPTNVNNGNSSSNGLTDWLSQHPEITKLGVNGIAAAIGTVFGVPAGLAAKLAATWLMSRNQNQNQQTLPPGKDFSGIDTTPAGYKPPPPRENVTPGYASGAASSFNSGQENRLANDPNQMAPDRLGGGQGFGYGLNYDSLVGGGNRGRFAP